MKKGQYGRQRHGCNETKLQVPQMKNLPDEESRSRLRPPAIRQGLCYRLPLFNF